MRVISGTLGGRRFASPGTTHTHPMGDKVRGALFNTLGDIQGLTVLDAFAGTGALSFEAISRGAERVTCIEQDITAQKTIATNIEALNVVDQAQLVRASANKWLETQPDAYFDLVLLDPPYNDLQEQLIAALAQRATSDGTVVLSWPAHQQPLGLTGFQLIKNSSYADAQLLFYQRTNS